LKLSPGGLHFPAAESGFRAANAVCVVAIVIAAISAATASTRIMRLYALPAAAIVCCCCPIIFVSFGQMGLLYTPTLAGMGRRVIAIKD
jgi:hypothetical protein